MKGLVIVSLLAGLIAGALWLLFRPSDQDLRRIEAETEDVLGALDEELRATAGTINRLRDVRPNTLGLDQQLAALRQHRALLEQQLQRETAESPAATANRGAFLDARKKTRDQAASDLATARALHERIRVVDEFVREVQPQVNKMIALGGELESARSALLARGVTLDDQLTVKLQTLTVQAAAARGLAAQVLSSGTENLDQTKTVAQTVKNEIERIIGEERELLRQVRAL